MVLCKKEKICALIFKRLMHRKIEYMQKRRDKMQKNYTIAVAGTGYKVRLYKSTLRL